MAAQKTNILHHGIRAGQPLRRYRSRVDTVGVKANASHDICPAIRRLEQRPGAANALKRRSGIGQEYTRDARMQSDENCVRLKPDRIRYAILTRGQVNRSVLGDGISQRVGIVRRAVTLGAQRADIDPGIDRRQVQNVRRYGIW